MAVEAAVRMECHVAVEAVIGMECHVAMEAVVKMECHTWLRRQPLGWSSTRGCGGSC